MYHRKKRESKLFMLVTIEMTMIDADSYKKCCDHDNQSYTRQCEIIEKLIPCMSKCRLDIVHSGDICRDLYKRGNIENPSMDTIENQEKKEIDEWKCEHTSSIERSIRNSREYKNL
jgi:hypothetical protein